MPGRTLLAFRLILTTLMLTVMVSSARPAPPKADKVEVKKPTVAVLYFDYTGKSDEMAMLRKGLAQMLISDLSELDHVRFVERDRLQEIIAELELNQTKKIDKKTANRIGKLLGAKYMVMGGYFDLMGTLRVDARVVEVETGKILKSVGSSGKIDEFMQIEQAVAKDVEAILSSNAIEGFTGKVRVRTTKSTRKRPKKLDTKTAARYGKALDAIDAGNKEEAKVELAAVVEAQPDFSLAAADLERLIQ